MTNEEEKHINEVKNSYSDILNRNGYGFQYSVLKIAHNLSETGKSPWLFLASEFPVEVRGHGTRIDFILKRKGPPPVFLLAECKRANPALSNWCFARAPYVHRKRVDNDEPLIIECAEIPYQGIVTASAKEKWSPKAHNPCHIGLEVRSGRTGDSKGESGKAIEDAATQVLRGLNGMIDMLSKHYDVLSNWKEDSKGAYFLPVVFTTAELWFSDVELSSAQIESGNIDLTNSTFSKQPWVTYQYHQSPGIKHSSSPENIPSDFSELMNTEYIRTIPFVNSAGIEPFLKWSSGFDF